MRNQPAGSTVADMQTEITPIALYVHWPFCKAKCPYCDFNSHVRERIDAAAWTNALVAEIARLATEIGPRTLTSLFFGGGTPSLMEPATVAAVIETASRLWHPATDVEITLEANPTSVEATRLSDFRAAGVNRLSLGIQALDDAQLRFLGREHSAREALAALELAARLFERYSFDLIYALPGHDLPGWQRDLDRALNLAGDHLSLYQLTIEDNTPFAAAVRRGDWRPLDDDAAADLYAATGAALDRAGFTAYEVSNYARPGGESRHNLTYWRYGDYAGVGPGAHGRLTLAREKWATEQIRTPEAWLAAAVSKGSADRRRTSLSPRERAEEALLLGLRLAEGVPLARIEAEYGGSPADVINQRALSELTEDGLLTLCDGWLRASDDGRLLLDSVLGRLLAA